jgi:predicted RNase H-like HicB family nuclease
MNSLQPRRCTAVYERDGSGMWTVELFEKPRVHSYGRTLAKARANITDAASLWFGRPETVINLVDEVHLPKTR